MTGLYAAVAWAGRSNRQAVLPCCKVLLPVQLALSLLASYCSRQSVMEKLWRRVHRLPLRLLCTAGSRGGSCKDTLRLTWAAPSSGPGCLLRSLGHCDNDFPDSSTVLCWPGPSQAHMSPAAWQQHPGAWPRCWMSLLLKKLEQLQAGTAGARTSQRALGT